MAGALAITLAAAGSVKTMMGLGQETVEDRRHGPLSRVPAYLAAQPGHQGDAQGLYQGREQPLRQSSGGGQLLQHIQHLRQLDKSL